MYDDKSCNIISKSPRERYFCYDTIVGRGTTKRVYLGYDSHTGAEVAWNSIKIGNAGRESKKMILNELNILQSLAGKCQYIMNYYDAWYDKASDEIIFVTELATFGSIDKYVKKIGSVNINVVKKWAKQILIGIDFLHENNIIHRDIKCNNIFINSNTSNIIIGDFGTSKKTTKTCDTIIGTQLFMAPEIWSGEYDKDVDIYAFGLCILEIITNKLPFEEFSKSFIWVSMTHNEKPKNLSEVSDPDAKKFITKCIDRDPHSRPSSTELLSDPFITNINHPIAECNSSNLKELVQNLNVSIPHLSISEYIQKSQKIRSSKTPKETNNIHVSSDPSSKTSSDLIDSPEKIHKNSPKNKSSHKRDTKDKSSQNHSPSPRNKSSPKKISPRSQSSPKFKARSSPRLHTKISTTISNHFNLIDSSPSTTNTDLCRLNSNDTIAKINIKEIILADQKVELTQSQIPTQSQSQTHTPTQSSGTTTTTTTSTSPSWQSTTSSNDTITNLKTSSRSDSIFSPRNNLKTFFRTSKAGQNNDIFDSRSKLMPSTKIYSRDQSIESSVDISTEISTDNSRELSAEKSLPDSRLSHEDSDALINSKEINRKTRSRINSMIIAKNKHL